MLCDYRHNRINAIYILIFAFLVITSFCCVPSAVNESTIAENNDKPRKIDENRLNILEKISIGTIPNTATNLLQLICYYNDRVKSSGCEDACKLGLFIQQMDESIYSLINKDIMSQYFISKNNILLSDIKIHDADSSDWKRTIINNNLRELLWMLVKAYSLRIDYKENIIIGYGWDSRCYITSKTYDAIKP